MQLLKYMAPKGLLKRWTQAPAQITGAQSLRARPAVVRAKEPIETIVDRYEANLPSIHKLICLNRELFEHRQSEMDDAEAQRKSAVRSFRYRALGALPLCTLALEVNQLSQAGLASAHASSVTLVAGAAAALLTCMSVAALGTAKSARRRKAVLSVRLDELQGAIERETRAATRTLNALDTLRQAARPIDHDITQVIGAERFAAHRPQPRLQAFSDVVTPPPGWPHATFAGSKPGAMSDDAASGKTFRRPH